MGKTFSFSVTMKKEQIESLEAFCAKKGRNRSEVIQVAVKEYIDNNGMSVEQWLKKFFFDSEWRKKNGQGKT